MDAYDKLIKEIVDMSDVKFPSEKEIATYVNKDLKLMGRIKSLMPFGKDNPSYVARFFEDFYKEYKIKFIVEYESGSLFRKSGSFTLRDSKNPVITIHIKFLNKDILYISKLIRGVLIHELVHFKQELATLAKGNLEKQDASYNKIKGETPLHTVKYYLHQLERGAEAYELAREFFHDENGDNIDTIIVRKMPKFVESLQQVWPSLNNMQRKRIRVSFDRFRREYLNQRYNLQQQEKGAE